MPPLGGCPQYYDFRFKPALCELYERAAMHEMAESGLDPAAFRPMSEEEDLLTFQCLNTVRVACVDDVIAGFVALVEPPASSQ